MKQDTQLLKNMLEIQRNEITEYHIYTRLAALIKDAHNAEVLRSVGEAEKTHAEFWEKRTRVKVAPRFFKVFLVVVTTRILGLTFTLKQMERREGTASRRYARLVEAVPEAGKIGEEESAHERALLNMLNEEHLEYVGSIVLGLNDALVELTGSLAGFTLALGETKLISLAGLVTGVSASFSMAAADYLSGKAEGDPKAAKSALYTGIAYIITVILLILPFLLGKNKFVSLGITLAVAVVIILLFNYYLATAKDVNFKRRFLEMAGISLGVAALSFGIGAVLSRLLGV